ncbi:MAG TPA: protein kinase [Pseudonocardiaceae bacterium]|nr:protein kinase [Pseudonocardiaceae bacterium]
MDGWRCADDSLIGGRYQVGALVGSGAVAHVYRALDVLMDRPVAIKIFRIDPDPVTHGRFRHEAAALSRLSHPGLVSVLDAGVHEERPYLVLRLIDHDTLGNRLARYGPLTPADTAELGAGLAAAVAHVHLHRIVHRDIKPANILLDHEQVPYLADFGVALLSDRTRLTASNEMIGTAAYLAPEQVLGEPITPAIDVYALGLVLLECLTGHLEYGGGAPVEAAIARLHRQPAVPVSTPGPLAELLGAMTARDPADRPTAADCAHRLANLAPARPVVLTATVPAAATTRPVARIFRGRRIVVAGLGAVAVLCAVITSLASTTSTPGSPTVAQLPTHSAPPATTSSSSTAPVVRATAVQAPAPTEPEHGKDTGNPAPAGPGPTPGNGNGNGNGNGPSGNSGNGNGHGKP